MSIEMKRAAVRATLQVKAASDKPADGIVGSFSGYASVFGVTDFGGDVVMPGAFTAALAKAAANGRMPAMLWQHDQEEPIGVWRVMREDEKGLYVEGDIADTDEGRNAYALLKVGALSGMSIGYCIPDGCCELVKAPDGTTVFQITSVDLWEVSLVTFPMNDAARVESVKYAGPSMTVREFEKFLRDAGNFSASQAKAIAARGFKSSRDVNDENDEEVVQLLRRLSV